jgi:hypothetical protein
LAPQPSLALGLLHNLLPIQSGWISWRLLNNFLFYRVGLLVPRPTPTLEDQASVFISPRGRVAQLYPQARGTHFSRLLRHAWVTVGLFLFPGHHTGIFISPSSKYSPEHPVLKHPQCLLPLIWETKFQTHTKPEGLTLLVPKPAIGHDPEPVTSNSYPNIFP